MNNDKINELIVSPKRIINKPKRAFRQKNQHFENDFTSKSLDSGVEFLVRMRKHTQLIENFSIMLEYYSPELQKDIKLIRFNGPHYGMHYNKVINSEYWNNKSHIHKATQEAIELGIRAENFAEITEKYEIFEDALLLFWKKINIIDDIETFFPNIRQKTLFNIIK